MLTDEIALAMAEFFDQIGPSHDVITTLVRRSGLASFDPVGQSDDLVGKKRRLRVILTRSCVEDTHAGDQLVRALLEALRSHGSFVPDSRDFPGANKLHALQEAFRVAGYQLESDGQLLPLTFDALEGARLTEALEAYVRRALRGGDDDELVVGTSKDLIEAVARHVLVEKTGAYPATGSFEATIWQAYDRLGLTPPPRAMIQGLDPDPARALEQSLLLVAIAENRLRNQMGTGHGRPGPATASPQRARLVSQCSGVVSRLILDKLGRDGPGSRTQ
jgi:hypothetical protein